MIVKVTVNDNDFSGVIDFFMRSFYSNVVFPKLSKDADSETKMKAYHKSQELIRLLNPNYDVDWVDENKITVVDAVKDAFKRFVLREPEEDRKYLLDNLEVEILETLKDEWQNGTNFYWFQHGDAVIKL